MMPGRPSLHRRDRTRSTWRRLLRRAQHHWTRAQWEAVDRGDEVFMILTSVAQGDSPLARLSPIRFESVYRPWFIYRLSEARR